MRSLGSRVLATTVLALALLFLAGCSSSTMSYNPDGGSYDTDTVTSAAPVGSSALGKPVSDAPNLRHDALVELRSAGGDAAVLADLLTAQFPDNDRSVPFYAESADFEESPAWVIFEVWGPEGGTLEHTRVWVFDRETERVLFTAAVP